MNRYGGPQGRQSRKRRKSQPTQVRNLVQAVLGDLGLEAAARSYRIGERWNEAVGPQIAAHCRPVALRRGLLEVRVDSSVWCQQLQLQVPQILAALREVLGDEAPTDVRFRLGPIPDQRNPNQRNPRGNKPGG